MEEQKVLRRYHNKMKFCGCFFLFLAIFILLNACIGFSSSPYYERYVKCSKLEPDAFCTTLKAYVFVLYSFEVLGSLLLTIHGLLSIALLDHMKNLKLIRFLNKFTKTAIIIYTLLIICRVAVFVKVHFLVI